MKRILVACFFLFSGFHTVNSQELVVYGISPQLYLVHKVLPKESWYSVSRLYNTNVNELAKYNNTLITNGLKIGQPIRIPLTGFNLKTDNTELAPTDFVVPLYHIVEKSEGLYRIAINAGTTLESIRMYNNLNTDIISTGAKLVVGFLKLKKGESKLLSKAVPLPKESPIPVPKEITDPVIITPPVIKETVLKDTIIKKKETDITKENPKAPMKEVMEMPVVKKETEGVFKKEFSPRANKEQKGICAVFKTTSGWTDYKFYALVDGILPGTTIQITNPKNGKIVYAKVLGEMQELKQNSGLLIRVSNATASALDAGSESFEVKLKY
jgi:LysM repeat protein